MEDLTEILYDKGFLCWGAVSKDNPDDINEQTTQAIRNKMNFVWIPGILLNECPKDILGVDLTNYKDKYFIYLRR